MILNHHQVELGSTVHCHVTGKDFVTARDGCSFNYAWDRFGNVISDEGVNIAERAELLDRTKPFGCYLSSDGRHVTGWKGNILGHAITWSGRVGFCRDGCYVKVTDIHGKQWHGKNSGKGMYITLRPTK